jgi:hypothetical protein
MAAVVALAFVASGSATAQAGTLGIEGSAVVFRASDGESNVLTVFYDPRHGYTDGAGSSSAGFTASDAGGVGAGAGSGCREIEGFPRCPAAGIDRIVIYLGDGNDSATVTSSNYGGPYPTFPGTIEIRGGDGNDRMRGGPADSDLSEGYLLDGGNGDDSLLGSQRWSGTMLGGPGDDDLDLPPESLPGLATVLDGGPGDDSLYDLGGHPNSRIRAGDGDDFVSVRPSPAPAELSCGAGVDIVNAGNRRLQAPGFRLADDCEPLPTAKLISVKPTKLRRAVRKRLTVRIQCNRTCRIGGRVSILVGRILDESTVTLTGSRTTSGRLAFNLDRRAYKARGKRLSLELFVRMGRAHGARLLMNSKTVTGDKLRFHRAHFSAFDINPCFRDCGPLIPPY